MPPLNNDIHVFPGAATATSKDLFRNLLQERRLVDLKLAKLKLAELRRFTIDHELRDKSYLLIEMKLHDEVIAWRDPDLVREARIESLHLKKNVEWFLHVICLAIFLLLSFSFLVAGRYGANEI